MSPRLLDCAASEIRAMDKASLLASIAASEGRIIVCECVGSIEPMLAGVTNGELMSSMGADILLLNAFDVERPEIRGLPADVEPDYALRVLKLLTGRPIGINLEPVDERFAPPPNSPERISSGRIASAANARRAANLGADMLVVTGNPGVGVSNQTIGAALRELRAAVGDRLILMAGKMHAAGVQKEDGASILTQADIDTFIDAGADVILVPAPGTVPGITIDIAHALISHARRRGALTMTTIGTSQEGSDEHTIRQLALAAKMAGADVHHLGDAGYGGSALPENVMAYSIAIKGRRHTYSRIARSVSR